MALIKCKECGKEINEKAEICPHCGCRVKQNKLIVIAFVLIGMILVPISGVIIMKCMNTLKERKRENIREMLDGTVWTLKQDSFSIASKYDEREYKTFFPKTLVLTRYDLGEKCDEKKEKCTLKYYFYDVVSVEFVNDNNFLQISLVCFKYDKDKLTKTSCPEDEISEDEDFKNELSKHNIVYTKVK